MLSEPEIQEECYFVWNNFRCNQKSSFIELKFEVHLYILNIFLARKINLATTIEWSILLQLSSNGNNNPSIEYPHITPPLMFLFQVSQMMDSHAHTSKRLKRGNLFKWQVERTKVRTFRSTINYGDLWNPYIQKVIEPRDERESIIEPIASNYCFCCFLLCNYE